VRLRYQVFGWLLLKGWGADGGFDTVTQQTDLRFLLPCSRIGTRNVNHLSENLGAVNLQLTPADLREIDTALSRLKVRGGRMNEEQMRVVDQTA